MNPTITITGAWAELHGVPMEALDDCLLVLDPNRFYKRAFKERRWDGRVCLSEGRRFPGGLVERAVALLTEEGHDVRVIAPQETEELDLSRFDKTYLGKIGPHHDSYLWDHQVEAVRALLSCSRGILKSPTASGKTAVYACVARYLWEECGWRTLIVVPRRGLARQNAGMLRTYYGGDIEVGQVGDGKREIGVVTVGTAQTLIKFMSWRRKGKLMPADPVLRELVVGTEVFIQDEVHHGSSESWYSIAMHSRALRRYGLSGTPKKDDELANARLIGATGEIIYEVRGKLLTDLGLTSQPKICMVMSENASGPDLPTIPAWRRVHGKLKRVSQPLPYADAYVRGLVKNQHHNRAVTLAVEWLVDHGRQTLVLCRRKSHWKTLRALLDARGVEFLALWGDTETEERERAKHLLDTRKIEAILATVIFDEGEDVPNIGAIVLAEGVKVSTNALQRVGRGMRRKEGANDLWVVDFVPTCHPKLMEHAVARVEAWEAEGYPVRVLEEWPVQGDEPEGELLPFLVWD